jgi:hypothetical protein
MYKEIVNRLLSLSLRNQVKIDFNVRERFFELSLPIYISSPLPESVKKYVEARKDHTFKPHTTIFKICEERRVLLVQKIPFKKGFRAHFRTDLQHFWQMSKRMYRMFSEISAEEKLHDAIRVMQSAEQLDSDF